MITGDLIRRLRERGHTFTAYSLQEESPLRAGPIFMPALFFIPGILLPLYGRWVSFVLFVFFSFLTVSYLVHSLSSLRKAWRKDKDEKALSVIREVMDT